MQSSQKRRTFPGFSFAYSKFRVNFSHFQKNMTHIVDLFLNLRTLKNAGRPMSKKSPFREPFDKCHGKRVERLLQSER